MRALIIAGGKGARMGELTKEIPKAMLQIGGIPIIEHQVNLLRKYNLTNITILTGYLSEAIKSYLGDGKKFGVKITYHKEKIPLSTAGSIKEIEEGLENDFLVLYGDIMVNMDLGRLIRFHKEKEATATLVVHPNTHPYDSDLFEIDADNRIIRSLPKPHDGHKFYSNLVNAGLYVLSPAILSHLEKGVKADFGKDIFPKLVQKEKMYGYKTPEYLKDMGTPERLAEVNRDYETGRIHQLHSENKRPALFMDRDGVINPEVGLLYKQEEFRLLEGIGEAIRTINQSLFLAIVVTNQPVVARNLCTISELEKIHKKMETLLGKEGAYLDGIYYCPHHPDKGYPGENPEYKIDCDCRKPKTGMIRQAEKDFNIDLKNSFMIGDSDRDIECGRNAGLRTILIKTGTGCKNQGNKPDFVFDTLNEAVGFILKSQG